MASTKASVSWRFRLDGGDNGEQRADKERDAPAPRANLITRQENMLKDKQHNDRAELPTDQRNVLKTRIKPPIPLIRDLHEIGGACPIFPTKAQALNNAGGAKHDGSRQSDRCIGWGDGDHKRAEAHQRDRRRECVAAPIAVGELPEQKAAQRPDEKARRKEERDIKLLHDWIGRREKRACKIEGEGGIGVEIVPFDQIAGGPYEDRL